MTAPTGNVTLWLTVTDPGEFYPSGRAHLWVRCLDMVHTPNEGDHVEIFDDVDWTVRNRWWDVTGRLHITMAAMVVDPSDRQNFSTYSPNYAAPWRTDETRGDPIPFLEAAGWTRYLQGRAVAV